QRFVLIRYVSIYFNMFFNNRLMRFKQKFQHLLENKKVDPSYEKEWINSKSTYDYSIPALCICGRYRKRPIYPARSRTRLEYPHSLSYQANTFTFRSPITIVDNPSIMAE